MASRCLGKQAPFVANVFRNHTVAAYYSTKKSTSDKLSWRDKTEGVNDCPKNCLCSKNIKTDYKNVQLLSQFTSGQTGMILPRNITKICLKKQREIALAIRQSRTMGFMPYTYKLPEYLNGPKLF